MTARTLIDRMTQQERLNFLLTNRVPRRLLTHAMGWFSRVEVPWVRDLSIAALELFGGPLHLEEAKTTVFRSLHDCFTRELQEGARPVDPRPDVLVSPCDGIVGACGPLRGTEMIQAKGFPYALEDLLGDAEAVPGLRDGSYATIRLTATMYHRFHAPCEGELEEVTYIAGDTWNVNPIAVKRIERLYCRNERAVLPLRVSGSAERITLVAVAAILVASIRIHGLPEPLTLRYRGPNRLPCRVSFRKGQELGYFQHGSTIIAIGSPGLTLSDAIGEGRRLRMGEPLFRLR